MSKRQPTIKPSDVQGAKYLKAFLKALRPLHTHRDDPKRTLHYDELCAWLLLYFFSPLLSSLRALQQASDLEQIQKRLGLPRFSLGSFSESAALFDPTLLVPIIEQLSRELPDQPLDERLDALELRPTAVDGTLLEALPRLVWVLWGKEQPHGAKLHLQLDLLSGAAVAATLTPAGASEREQLRQYLQPGRLYLEDRGYFDYQLLADILAAGSSFVARAPGNIVYQVLGENPLTPEAVRAGVAADQLVAAGYESNRQKVERPLRLVRIEVAAPSAPREGARPKRRKVDAKTKLYREEQGAYTLLLLTDQLELDAELIGLLYRYRWQIELFFRWFKTVLQAQRLLALSQNGLTIVTYCALLASMLVTLWTGRKPTKRTYELLCFYMMGLVSDQELAAHLARLERIEAQRLKTK